MLQALYTFFIETISNGYTGGLQAFLDSSVSVGSYSIALRGYLAFIMALVSFVVIIVLCCLFIKKMVNIVGNLVR